jgi:hypothetical protein|tara:strand:+ start:4456 stop:5178 length:723 start_codon:yes stop_codon:yes gene_type:complete
MPLPKITTSQYELVLPSSGKKIKYRPFLVREEKILILALESEDTNQISTAVKQVLKECVIGRVKIEDLPSFDIEYLFLNIRGKSVGESIDIVVTCGDDGETKINVSIPIDKVEVEKHPDHNRDLELGQGYVLRMKYPTMGQFIDTNFSVRSGDDSEVERSFDIICSCIEQVYTEEDMWTASECSKKELRDWVESLTSEQFKKIEKFFETMPKLRHEIKVMNPNTKKENTVVLEGLSSFFA